jgi:endonuclease/exonuclease/phosphatase (EEP) superfamily protein YafD
MKALVRLIAGLVALMLIGAHAGTLLALLAGTGWPAELFSHFPVQYAIAQGFGVTFFLAVRPRWFALVSVPLLALNLWLLLPYYLSWQGPAAGAAAKSDPVLRLMTLNVNALNTRTDLVLRAIDAEQPDILAILEATPMFWDALPPEFRERYAYRAMELDAGPFGVALFSRIPFASHDIYHFGTFGRPAIAAAICTGDAVSPGEPACLRLLAIHPDPPITRSLAQSRDAQFQEIGEYLRDTREIRRVVMGDMNVTPWSPAFRNFAERNALRDSALGNGIHPTWFSQWLPFGVPIDHILYSDGVVVRDRRVGPDIGSDHFPVTADIVLAPVE